MATIIAKASDRAMKARYLNSPSLTTMQRIGHKSPQSSSSLIILYNNTINTISSGQLTANNQYFSQGSNEYEHQMTKRGEEE